MSKKQIIEVEFGIGGEEKYPEPTMKLEFKKYKTPDIKIVKVTLDDRQESYEENEDGGEDFIEEFFFTVTLQGPEDQIRKWLKESDEIAGYDPEEIDEIMKEKKVINGQKS